MRHYCVSSPGYSGSAHQLQGAFIKADHRAQLRLLDLQAADYAIAQLQHRRRTLPEHAEFAALTSERNAAAEDLVAAETVVSDLERDQRKAETDLEPVRQRLERDERRIADGSVADPRALSSLVEEVVHLRRRISDLEDAELEVMEALEAATGRQSEVSARVVCLDRQLVEVRARRDDALAELDRRLVQQTAARAGIAPDVPGDLTASYDKVRASHGGVGAAAIRQRRCTGCSLEINAAELRRFAAASDDEVLRCEECGRILIRTEDSGL